MIRDSIGQCIALHVFMFRCWKEKAPESQRQGAEQLLDKLLLVWPYHPSLHLPSLRASNASEVHDLPALKLAGVQ